MGSYLCYTRRSTDEAQEQRNSIEEQTKVCLEYAKNNGLEIAIDTEEGYVTNGIVEERHSAFKEKDLLLNGEANMFLLQAQRPKFMRMIADLYTGKYQGVIVKCWDRISRNDKDALIVSEMMDKTNVDIRFVEGNLNASDPTSAYLERSVTAMFSKFYSMNIQRKVKSTQQLLRSKGRCVYQSPIGYLDLGSDKKAIDPERGPLVARLFELYATGEWSLRQLLKWSIEQGLTTKPKRKRRSKSEVGRNEDYGDKSVGYLNISSLQYLVTNPFYIGKIKVPDGYAEGQHPPLISEDLFHQVQKRLQENNVTVKYVDKEFYAYRDFFKCAHCSRVYTPYRKKGHVYYSSRCKEGCPNQSRSLQERFLDEEVKCLLKRMVFTHEEIQEIEKGAQEGLKEVASTRNKDIDDLNRKRTNILKDLDYLKENRVRFLREGVYTPAGLLEESEKLKAGLKEVDAVLGKYTEAEEEMFDFVMTFSELVERATDLYGEAFDLEKRKILHLLVSELSLDSGKMASFKAREEFEPILNRPDVQNGSPGWIRTNDQLVNSQLLYH